MSGDIERNSAPVVEVVARWLISPPQRRSERPVSGYAMGGHWSECMTEKGEILVNVYGRNFRLRVVEPCGLEGPLGMWSEGGLESESATAREAAMGQKIQDLEGELAQLRCLLGGARDCERCHAEICGMRKRPTSS